MRASHLLAPVLGVHQSARSDPLTASRHASFIATHLAGGGLAAASLAWYLAAASATDALIVAALAWLAAPVALAAYLIRTGDLGRAHLLSAAHHTAIATLVAASTGGLSSFVVPWLLIIPVEAALSAARRVIAIAFAMSLGALAILGGLEAGAVLPDPRPLGLAEGSMHLAGLVSAGLYACLLAMAIESLSRRSEQAARDSARDYRLMAENATDLISVHGTDGQASFVSHGAGRLFGEDPARFMGAGFLDAVSVGERPAFLTAIGTAAREGLETSVTYRLGRAGGASEPVWVETRCRPLEDPSASPRTTAIAVTRDISEARAREDELRRARDEAESASRAKSRFLANVSHELRTPLNAIIGFSAILAEPADVPPVQDRTREFAGLISESGTHLLNIVNDLLDMSRIEANRYEIAPAVIALGAVMRICAEVMGPAASDAEVTIEVDAGTPPPCLVADERAVKQIVLNLLSNAVKFSNAGGTIVLTAREADHRRVEIAVADQGIGIAAADLARLGEPFVQAEGDYNRKYEGAGLGLSVVKGLVRLHGGELAIASEPGKGTRVSVLLPGEAQHDTATPRAAPAPEPVAARG